MLFGILTIGAVLMLVGLAIPSCRPQFETPTDSLGWNLLIVAGIGAVTSLILYQLTRKDIATVFKNDTPDPSRIREATNWGWVLAIVGGLAVAERSWVEISYENLLEGTFAINTTFRIVDATTGEPIEGIIIRSGYSSWEPTSPNIRTTLLSSSEMRYSGFAYHPIDLNVGADGYEGVDVTIDENTPLEFRFSLSRSAKDDPPE